MKTMADGAIRMVWWMAERAERLALESDDLDVQRKGLDRMREQVMDRALEGNQLRPEGIEDQYIFAPGAKVTRIGKDLGRSDLARPVEDRTWLRVTYQEPRRAPLDEDGRRIHAITVGVNLSEDGYVLKAGILGNLEIDRDSLSYWPGAEGD